MDNLKRYLETINKAPYILTKQFLYIEHTLLQKDLIVFVVKAKPSGCGIAVVTHGIHFAFGVPLFETKEKMLEHIAERLNKDADYIISENGLSEMSNFKLIIT